MEIAPAMIMVERARIYNGGTGLETLEAFFSAQPLSRAMRVDLKI